MSFIELYEEYDFKVDGRYSSKFQATQGDEKSRGFLVRVVSGGQPVSTSGMSMKLFIQSADGGLHEQSATRSGERFSVGIPSGAFDANGTARGELVLYGSNQSIMASDEILFHVRKSVRFEGTGGIPETKFALLEKKMATYEDELADFDSRWQQLIDETTGKDVVSAPEIIASRVSKERQFSSLSERLSSIHEVYINVKDFGAKGDGATHDDVGIQNALDYASTNGGGAVLFPAGIYLINGRIEIPSNCHLIGQGRNTIFTADRPSGQLGGSIIVNKGYDTATGYNGASNFSISNITIDSPTSNGIVLVHAKNVVFKDIISKGLHHHTFDIAGSKNIKLERIVIEDHNTSSPIQLDGHDKESGRYNNSGSSWVEGGSNTSHDRTVNDNILIRDVTIDDSNKGVEFGIHLHRFGGKNITIENVFMDSIKTGIYKDPNVARDNLTIRNVTMNNMTRGIYFERAPNDISKNVTIENVVMDSIKLDTVVGSGTGAFRLQDINNLILSNITQVVSEDSKSYTLNYINNVNKLTVNNLVAESKVIIGNAIFATQSDNVFISGVQTRGFTRLFHWFPSDEVNASLKVNNLMAKDVNGETIYNNDELLLNPATLWRNVEGITWTFYETVIVNHDEVGKGRTFKIGELKEGYILDSIYITHSESNADYWDDGVELTISYNHGNPVISNIILPYYERTWDEILRNTRTQIRVSDSGLPRDLFLSKNKETTRGKSKITMKFIKW